MGLRKRSRGGALGVVFQGRVGVGVVWEIPRLRREQALRSAERRPAGREGARHRPAARSRPPAGPWRASPSRALVLGQDANEAVT